MRPGWVLCGGVLLLIISCFASLTAGACLAVAGVLMRAMTRNPLA